MKSLQIVLIALVALVAAVVSKRGLLARVGLAAALAVSLLCMASHGAQAGSFNPTGTVGGAETKRFQSRDGVDLEAQVNDATWPDAATLNGYFIVSVE